jgi:hypothetical protein
MYVVTNVGGVYEAAKSQTKKRNYLRYCKKSKQQEAMQWLQSQCLLRTTVGKCEHLKNIDLQDTQNASEICKPDI